MVNKPPLVAREVVEWLERLFPDKLPINADVTQSEIMWNAGAASVVRKVRNQYDLQQRDSI